MHLWSRRMHRILILFAFHVFQLACGTTVTPLCKPGESADSCTTAMVKTDESSRAAPVKIARCKAEMENFCWNGQCMYLVELDEHYCRCDTGFTGIRCVHSELVTQPTSPEYLALTIFLTLLSLLAIAVASFFAYQWHKNKKLRESSKKYQEVLTQNL
ncbi:proepiregulin-like [Bombina bombina]|uniref:proepiregulin n=1 Tax=Bombina bombina TaxID=8345 RepID=UPI00235B111B|nr:proepiregulin [Bombina bombina]XP_053559289.1 proepiregulin-like [Bombina bombina]